MSSAHAKSALSGPRKAAILLTVIGEEAAAVICRQLSSADMQQIAAELASLDAISPELAQQVLEERVDGSPSAESQFVWGIRYVDDCVLRDRDTTGSGVFNERLYAMQDAPGIQRSFGDSGLEVLKETPQQFQVRMRKDYNEFRSIVKAANLKPE